MSPIPTPSVREVLERAKIAGADRSADILLMLAEFEQELGWDDVMPGLCTEHQAVANRMAELHLLVDHMAANLRGGHGVPPTPPEAAPRRRMPPVTHTKARGIDAPPAAPRGIGAAIRRLPNAEQQANARANRPDGLLTRAEAMRFVGYGPAGFAVARKAGRIPDPCSYQGRSPLWRREQLEGINPLRAGRAATPTKQGPTP